MRLYVILVQDYGPRSVLPKVSQQGYRTLEEAQEFCRSRSAKQVTRCGNGYVYWCDEARYEIVEVTV